MTQKKILIVDDEELIVLLIRSRLQVSGYEVDVAYDGLEALERYQACQPDLIILDIMMPKMDGREFIQHMKQTGELGKVPIIVLTAKTNMMDTYLRDGATSCVAKPFEAEELLREVRNCLGTES